MTTCPLSLTACLLTALGATSAASQSIPLLRTAPGGTYDLVCIEESGLATTTALQGATLLDLALAGRPVAERFRADLPTARDDGLAPRVRLPTQGSLYRTQTATATQLVLVRTDGSIEVLIERPSGAEPALLDHVAVSDDGSRVLVGTPFADGGDVLAISLDAAPNVELLTPGAALDVAPESLRTSTSTAWFVGDDRVRRAQLGSGQSAPVPAAYAPGAIALAELAVASSGRRAAWISQWPDGQRHVWAAEQVGAAVRQTELPGDYATPGYADPAGPFLVADSSSSWIAWCRDMPVLPGGSSDEVFARRLSGAATANQLTADGLFTDTIDSIGGLGFVAAGQLTFFAGEPPDEPGQLLGSADLYLASLDTPGPIGNLTLTSGEAASPFLTAGELELLDVFHDPSGARRLMLVDPDGGDYGMLAQAVDGGPLTTLMGGLDVAPTYAPAGDSFFAHVVTAPNASQLLLLRPDGSSDLVANTVPQLVIDRLAVSRDGTRAAFVASAGPDVEIGLRLDLASAGLELLWPAPLHWAPRLAFSASGNLAAGMGLSGGPFLFVAFDGPASGFVLPGGTGAGFPLDG